MWESDIREDGNDKQDELLRYEGKMLIISAQTSKYRTAPVRLTKLLFIKVKGMASQM